MSTATKVRWEVLYNHQIDHIAERTLATVKRDPHYSTAFEALCASYPGYSDEEGQLDACVMLVKEALKFLAAAATPGKPKMVPGRLVDAAWHQLILDTRLYERLCKDMGLPFIHHNPNPQSSGWDRPGVYQGTITWMAFLGYEPNRLVWGESMAEYCADHEPEDPDDDRLARCSSCSGG